MDSYNPLSIPAQPMDCIYGIHMLDIFSGVSPQTEEHQMVGLCKFRKM